MSVHRQQNLQRSEESAVIELPGLDSLGLAYL